jgi:RNA polymerase sigma factor (sigma-70 family)
MASTDSAPKSKIASVGEQAALCRDAQQGDKKAEAKLVAMHMPIIFREARRLARTARGQLDVDDLVTEGAIGLMRAIELYNPELGIAFLTYGFYWLKSMMIRAIVDHKYMIRIPCHRQITRRKLNRARGKLAAKGNYSPTTDDLVETSGLSKKHIIKNTCICDEPAWVDMRYSGDNDIDDERDLFETLSSDEVWSDDRMSLAQLRVRIQRRVKMVLPTLTKLERDIFEGRILADRDDERNLLDIGHDNDLSRERVRQIQVRLEERLRKEFWAEWSEYLGMRGVRNAVPMSIVRHVLNEISPNPHSDHLTRTSRRAWIDLVAHYLSIWGHQREELKDHAAYLVRAFEAEMEPKACAIAIVKMILMKLKETQ